VKYYEQPFYKKFNYYSFLKEIDNENDIDNIEYVDFKKFNSNLILK
jgi:hypothetical protein